MRIAHRASRARCVRRRRRRRCVVRGPPTCVRERIVVWRRRPRARTGDANYLRDAPQGGPFGIHPSMSMSMSIDIDVDRSMSIDGLRMRRTVERSNGRMRAAREGCVCVCVCLCVCVFSMDGWIGVDFTNHDQGRRRRRHRRRGVSVGDVMSSDVMIMGKTDHGQ